MEQAPHPEILNYIYLGTKVLRETLKNMPNIIISKSSKKFHTVFSNLTFKSLKPTPYLEEEHEVRV